MISPLSRLLRFVIVSAVLFGTAIAQDLSLTPYHPSGIYAVGSTVGWKVRPTNAIPAGGYSYTIKENNFTLVKSGRIESGTTSIEAALGEPGMLYLEIAGAGPDGKPLAAGAAVAPTAIKPDTPRPADFDAFWAGKIEWLQSIPADPVVTPEKSERAGIEYATIRLNNINGSHVYGQLAKPARPGKFPAMLIMQWAGGPYPLQKSWVIDRAAEGWLALDIEPHDVPGNMPQAYYDALPEMIKDYTSIYNDERDRNYFLRMYLGDYRALDYLAGRPDWDGKILVATGTSMGGQQSFAVAGLNPKVTHMVVLVPAGADSNAERHRRFPGYPNWDASNPNVMKTALYFDTVNFAPRIHATCLVAMGFIDNVCPAVGVWTAFNQIAGRKEAVPLIYAAHNHQSTPAQLKPYTDRSEAWFAKLVHDEEPELRPLP